MQENPFSAPSSLPYAFPPFDAIGHEHYRPAFDAGVDEQRAEVEAIATDPAAPTFENTIEALERSGGILRRFHRVFGNLAASMSTPEMQALETELAPLIAKHHDEILLDGRLFERVAAVHAGRGDGLTPEQVRVVERYHLDFVRAGAALPEGDRDTLRGLNVQITSLTTEFSNKVLAEANDLAVQVTDRAELDGLPDSVVQSAASAAEAAGKDGFLLTLSLPTIQPAMLSLRNRDLRRRLHEASTSRGTRGNDNDTRELVSRITALRAERAALLGYDDHAAYVVADQTAGSTDAVLSTLGEMAEPAMRNLDGERARIEELMRADGIDEPVQPWDWAYYAAQDKAATYDVDTDALRPYFELERVLHVGILVAASRLYGLTFQERRDLPVYAPDVRVYEVFDEDGTAIGLFVCDWFARPTKQGGAWMDEFVGQSRLLGTKPVVVVCLNVPKPPAGQPALMTIDEVRTGFHEFGHALHGLFSAVDYPRLQGTSVPRDFVEFPSQVNEMWAWHPEVLAGYALHHETGEPLAQDVVDRLIASQSHGQGFDTVAMLGAALLDQEWHRLSTHDTVDADHVESFENEALTRHGVRSALVPPRYRSGYFAHVFAGGYDAGYYSYLWSEVLDADMVGWFTENGGLVRGNGDRFRQRLLSVGGTVDPLEAFAAVRGRAPSIDPLLRRRGLRA
ncbi:MAG: M3 family metallopeptidase [Nocardioidaceae bacterium]|nr:M3 family metallopeptidase [Nocardioidaceae bacterium]NUS51115.1 M3 family metallopeptidase [Nocardioidaceae bacterium]